jgi:hypothetical protein
MAVLFVDNSDSPCRLLCVVVVVVVVVVNSIPNCCHHLLADCSHNVESCILHKMFQMQKEDASYTVRMSCDSVYCAGYQHICTL